MVVEKITAPRSRTAPRRRVRSAGDGGTLAAAPRNGWLW